MDKEDLAAAQVALRIMERSAEDYLYGPVKAADCELLCAVNNVLEAIEEVRGILRERETQP